MQSCDVMYCFRIVSSCCGIVLLHSVWDGSMVFQWFDGLVVLGMGCFCAVLPDIGLVKLFHAKHGEPKGTPKEPCTGNL